MAKHPRRTREGFAVARDGSPIYYRVVGKKNDRPAVALLDGIGCDGFVWKYLEPALGPEQQIVHLHYRGHGRTPVPRDITHVSIPDLSDDLETVLDTVDVDRAVLIGHSMGVQVCLETFRRHHQRVAGLALICGAYGNPLRTFKGNDLLERALPYASFAIRHAPRMFHKAWRQMMPTRLAFALAQRVELNPELTRLDDFMPYLEHMATVDLPLFLEMLAQAGRHSAKQVLPSIDVPTLVVAGDSDGFTPLSLSEEMHQAIPGATLLVIKNGTHTAPIERPQRVNDAIIRFLASVEPSRKVAIA